MPAVRFSSLVTVLMLAVMAQGCAAGSAAMAPQTALTVDASMADPGGAARQEVLDRYAAGAPPTTLMTPSIVGRSPGSAEQVLSELGLQMRLVAFDRRHPITEQHPAAGQPVPLDGVVEARLGQPPEEAEEPVVDATPAQPIGPATPLPLPTDTVTATPTPDPALAAVDQVAAQYVLPPHTDGLLRINPRHLPTVPFGTELTGQASWYGPGFHGRTTACGGVYDQNGATLATRELRCGTVVRITGPTGLTVEATVTDWGPAEWTGRRFDLSAAVFNAIAPLGAGVVAVRIITANVPR